VTGCILALVVPGPCRFFGLFWREDDFIIPWDCIKRIGEDNHPHRGRRGFQARKTSAGRLDLGFNVNEMYKSREKCDAQ
jgi:hypothetical protein